MATRQEIQFAQDFLRYVNIMNDLIDVGGIEAQGKEESTGLPIKVPTGVEGEFRSPTFEELRERVRGRVQAAGNYYLAMQSAMAKIPAGFLDRGLTGIGIDLQTILTDLEDMRNVCDQVLQDMLLTKDKTELVNVGTYIEQNVTRLTLLRRTWCLGA